MSIYGIFKDVGITIYNLTEENNKTVDDESNIATAFNDAENNIAKDTSKRAIPTTTQKKGESDTHKTSQNKTSNHHRGNSTPTTDLPDQEEEQEK